MSKSNLTLILERILEVKEGEPVPVSIPFQIEGEPPATFKVEIPWVTAREIITLIKRVANMTEIKEGRKVIFPDPVDFPNPDEEISARITRSISDTILQIDELADPTERAALLKQLKGMIDIMKPDARMSSNDFDTWKKVLRKYYRPDLTESEILSLIKSA